MSPPRLFSNAAQMRDWSVRQHNEGRTIALVPTMGYLHEGHLALVREAKKRADRVVVSIFVNPTQFGAGEDFESYPRDVKRDLAQLSELAVDAVFTPEREVVYPADFDTYVCPERMASGLCGSSRPTHFRGVATVVLILFRVTLCDVAIFGEKDFQQLQIIRRMTRDLWLDVQVVGVPIVREPDALAMSSRNVYLSPKERRDAVVLSRTLAEAKTRVAQGETRVDSILNEVRASLSRAPHARVDYAAVVDEQTLEPLEHIDRPAVLALAVFLGKTRLIDNCRLLPPAVASS